MKKLIRIWLLLIPAMWVFYIGVAFLVCKALGHNFDLLEKGISAAIFLVIFSLGQWMGYSYSIFPRIKYLENDDTAKPSFKDTSSSMVTISQGFDFNRLKTEIADKWMITFFDDEKKVLKFRTKIRFFSWGAATWLRYDSDTGEIQICCFPIVSMMLSDARKMQKEIERCLKVFDRNRQVTKNED